MKNDEGSSIIVRQIRRFSPSFSGTLRISRRLGGGTSLGVVFFLILVTLSAFAIGPDLALLGKIAPAILWISGLLATLLGLDRLFQADYEDGSLDLLLTSRTPLELIVLVKCLAHWLLTGLPLAAAAPFFGLMLNLPASQLWSVTLSLLAGNTRPDLDRRNRRGPDGELAARRPFAGNSDFAAVRASADLRRRGGGGWPSFAGPLRDAFSDSLRANSHHHRRRAIRGGFRIAACKRMRR